MLENLLKDLEKNRDLWNQEGSRIQRRLKFGNTEIKFRIEQNYTVNVTTYGVDTIDHDIKLAYWDKKKLVRAVEKWKEELLIKVFSVLGK